MLTLYLMSYKGFQVLRELTHKISCDIIDCVISDKDSNIQNDYYEEIKTLCINLNIKFYDRGSEINIKSKYSIAISWRWIIRPCNNIIVIHDSILPKYRGFNPLVTALINGDSEIGVTALFATEEFDAGDIIYQSKTNISYPIKIENAIELISYCYIETVLKICSDLVNNIKLVSVKQSDINISYSLWRDEFDYRINWNDTAENIIRFINAVGFPYKGASCLINDILFRIIEAEEFEDLDIVNRVPGKIMFIKKEIPYVVCGKGILKILKLVDESSSIVILNKVRLRIT